MGRRTEEGRSGTGVNTPTVSDPKETTDWQVAKGRRGKLRQPRGVSKSVQQRAEEREEIESLLALVNLPPNVRALVSDEEKIPILTMEIAPTDNGIRETSIWLG